MSQESLQEQASIHLDHLEHIQTGEAREAYLVLLLAGWRAGYRTVAKTYPRGKRDVHFEAADDRPFALIANQEDVRVYLRKPGVGSDTSKRAEFSAAFGDRVSEPEGEMAANVSNATEASIAASILFNAP
jgi:hypothetical protein